MKTTTTLLRTGSALAATGSLVGMLSACTPESKPAPKETKAASAHKGAFESIDAAAEAAETTYRGYVASSNDVDLSSPETLEPVFGWLSGDALTSARESYSAMRADNLTFSGESTFDHFEVISHDDEEVTAQLCVDVGKVDLVNSEGDSVIPTDRTSRKLIEVRFVRASTSSGLAITRSTVVQETQC